jgi:hypothetical protein
MLRLREHYAEVKMERELNEGALLDWLFRAPTRQKPRPRITPDAIRTWFRTIIGFKWTCGKAFDGLPVFNVDRLVKNPCDGPDWRCGED